MAAIRRGSRPGILILNVILLAVTAAVRATTSGATSDGSAALDRHFAPTAVPDRIVLAFGEPPKGEPGCRGVFMVGRGERYR